MKKYYSYLDKDKLVLFLRFTGILLVPVLAYFNVSFEDLDSWKKVWEIFLGFISTPYIFVLTAINFFLMIPVSITKKGVTLEEEIDITPISLKKGVK